MEKHSTDNRESVSPILTTPTKQIQKKGVEIVRKYTVKRDYHDSRDLVFDHVLESSRLPKKVDMRSKMSPVVDQGQLGSCTANAIVSGLREFLLLKSGAQLTELSRLFLYYNERAIEGTVNEDSGAYIRDGMKSLQKQGVCTEKDFPYDISKFTNKPSEVAYGDATQFKINEYHRILTINSLKTALAHGEPVVFGMVVYDSFESKEVANTGHVPMPKRGEQELGGHAMLFVGYDDDKQVLIVRNSWGEDWGDNGYCYLPYDMVNRHFVTDMWKGQ